MYTGDIIVTSNDDAKRQVLGECLAREFEINALGRLKCFLGIDVAHFRQGILSLNKSMLRLFLKKQEKYHVN